MNPPGLGASPSPIDSRTAKHSVLTTITTAPIKGGYDYSVSQIDNQRRVGICTAISLTQNRERANGKKYSADFQYLLQKKYYYGNWNEGSSILNALKVGKKYGFLPAELWTHTVEADRDLSYSQYISKLQLTDAEVLRLTGLCVDNLLGYASINVADPQALARAIVDSDAG